MTQHYDVACMVYVHKFGTNIHIQDNRTGINSERSQIALFKETKLRKRHHQLDFSSNQPPSSFLFKSIYVSPCTHCTATRRSSSGCLDGLLHKFIILPARDWFVRRRTYPMNIRPNHQKLPVAQIYEHPPWWTVLTMLTEQNQYKPILGSVDQMFVVCSCRTLASGASGTCVMVMPPCEKAFWRATIESGRTDVPAV